MIRSRHLYDDHERKGLNLEDFHKKRAIWHHPSINGKISESIQSFNSEDNLPLEKTWEYGTDFPSPCTTRPRKYVRFTRSLCVDQIAVAVQLYNCLFFRLCRAGGIIMIVEEIVDGMMSTAIGRFRARGNRVTEDLDKSANVISVSKFPAVDPRAFRCNTVSWYRSTIATFPPCKADYFASFTCFSFVSLSQGVLSVLSSLSSWSHSLIHLLRHIGLRWNCICRPVIKLEEVCLHTSHWCVRFYTIHNF